MAIKNSIHCELLPLSTDLEILSIQIGSLTIYLGNICPTGIEQVLSISIYNEYYQSLFTLLHSVYCQSEKLILLGDFNSPDIDWGLLHGECWSSTELCDLIFELDLFQVITTVTHKQGNILIVQSIFPNILRKIRRYAFIITIKHANLRVRCHY